MIRLEWPKPGYARITLARPDHHNALRNQDLEAIDVAIQKVADSDCRVVSLVAEGRSFSVGGDVSEFGAMLDGDAPTSVREGGRFVIAAIARLRRMNAALIVGAQGNVAGGAAGFLLAGDFIVVADDVKINLAYVRIGASQDAGVSWFLPRRVGPQKAFELLAFAETIDAGQALEAGLANRVAPSAALHSEVDAIADRLLAIAPSSLRSIKRLLQASTEQSLETHLHAEFEAFAAAAATPAFRDGVQAFLTRAKSKR